MQIAITRPAVNLGSTWISVAIFLAATMTFVLVCHTYFSSMWVPLADSASNAMLVLDAKHFRLLHGNYSRVGFYHPGPHLFYLMAAGEFLFHDLLGIAKSTEAGQLLAVVCLTIAILQIIERIYRDLAAGDLLISLCATAATASCVVVMLPDAFTSLWVPYTYIPAGLLFFVGAAALIAGMFKWLWAFVLGSAMLLSAHASFLGLVPMMGLVLVCAIVVLQPQTRSLSGIRALMSDYRASVIASAVILAVLFLPILLNVMLHFPGEFGKYLEFAGRQPRKGWIAVASTLLPYWKFLALAALVFLASFLTARTGGLSDGRGNSIAAAAIAICIAATGAVVFYIQRGVDDISSYNLYVVWWYQAAPATCIGLAVVYLGTATTRRLPFLAMLIALIAAGFWFMRGPVPTGGADSANVDRSMALLEQKSRETGAPVRIALDTKPSQFIDMWARAVALIAEQERRGGEIACIETYDWHISYHARNRCAPADPTRRYAHLVASYEDLSPIGGRRLWWFVGLQLFEFSHSDWPADRVHGPWVGSSEDAAPKTGRPAN